MFKKLNILKFKDLLKYKILTFYNNYKHLLLTKYLKDTEIVKDNESNNYSTRNRNRLHIPITRHKFAENCIRFQIPLIINDINDNIVSKVNTHSMHGYSQYIKHFFNSQYSDICQIENCYICNRANI